ncbi:MAG: Gfo/Idh/MocA family oxidoreductase [Peptostreptococcaceae bacterium]|nr:Gfo/Idh/MocA family oxidoreductase [Peptostreptococcaceae bacterium]
MIMVRVALVGLGFMGRMHLSIYGNLKNVQITALCDSREESLDLSKSGGGNIAVGKVSTDISKAKMYTDYKKMLDEGGFDYVDLCVPTFVHKELSVLALKAGYDVFCEKPMALKKGEADEMIQVSKEAGKLLTVGQCLRFWPMYVKVKEMIDSGKYGKVISAEFSRYSPSPTWTVDNWILGGELSGNAALDLHIHDVDIVHFYFGTPKAVTSSGVQAPGGGFGHIATLYDYPDKTVTSVGNWLCSDSFGLTMRALVVLEKGVINLDTSQPEALVVYVDGEGKFSPVLDTKDGYYYELESFIDNVATRKVPTVVTPESARDSLTTVLAEIKSATIGEQVTL